MNMSMETILAILNAIMGLIRKLVGITGGELDF